jgi:integrase
MAENKARKRDDDLGLKRTRPRTDEKSGPSFADLAADYLVMRDFNANSRKQLKIRLVANILPYFGDISAIRITYNNVDQYIARRRKTVSSSTVRREITDIKAILTWAVKRRPPLIPMNPIRDYIPPHADDAIINPPSHAEIKAILEHANERLRRAILLAWYTGLRPGAVELFSLRWDAIMWDKGIIRITSAAKGGPRLRNVPIHPIFISELQKWQLKDNNPMGHIIHFRGAGISTLESAWHIAKKKAGITRRLRMYDLRHFFVTTAIEAGADYKTLSEIVGSSPETLRKYYQHVSSSARISIIEKMPEMI